MKIYIFSCLQKIIFTLFLYILLTTNINAEEIKKVLFKEYSLYSNDSISIYHYGKLLPISKENEIKTYHFKSEIMIPLEFNNIPIGIVMGPAFYPIEISINNFNIYYQSNYKKSDISYILNTVTIPIDRSLLINNSKLLLQVTVHTKNERHPLPEIYLTSYSKAISDTFWRNFYNITLVQAGFIASILIALYFLFIFIIHKKKLFLYFCFLALLYSLVTVNMTFNYASNAFVFLEKISRISFPFCILFLFFFITEYTDILKNFYYKIINFALIIPFSIRTLLSATRYEVSIKFNETIIFYIIPNLILCFTIITISVIKNHFKKKLPVFIAILIIILTSIYDIVFVISNKTPFVYLTNYGYLFLVFSIFFILAREQSVLNKELLITKKELEKLNKSLEKKVEERTAALKELSLRDPLTGLRNRRYISEFVSELVESFKKSKILALRNKIDRRNPDLKNKVIGIFLIDIDHFKKINDTYGHNTGDEVLIILSNKLKEIIRADDIIIRWGGEEFFILLNRTIPKYIPLFCKKLLNLFRNTIIEINESIKINRTCSVGCISFPLDEKHPDVITFEKSISISDMALYLSKEGGRDRATYIKINKKALKNINQKSIISIFHKKTLLNNSLFIKQIII